MLYPDVLTLRIWLITAAVLLALIGASRLAKPSGQLASHLPTTDGILLLADVDKIRSAGVLDAIAGKSGIEEKEYLDFVQTTGFDYCKHLHGLAAVLLPDRNYFVLEGTLDRSRLERYAQSQGGLCLPDLCRFPASQPGRWVSLKFLNSSTLLLAVAPNDSEVLTMVPEQPKAPQAAGPFYARLSGKDLARVVTGFEKLKEIGPALTEIVQAEVDAPGTQIRVRLTLPDAARAQQALSLLKPLGPWQAEQNQVSASWPLTSLLP